MDLVLFYFILFSILFSHFSLLYFWVFFFFFIFRLRWRNVIYLYHFSKQIYITFSQWRMLFQIADFKKRNFLDLLDNNLNPIEPSSIKGSLWLQHFRHSNLLCAQATKAIINHAPIEEYWLKFFPREDFSCLYDTYPIETRQYILHECKRFNKYCNLRRDTVAYFMLFLQCNSSVFSFE